jgi:hypothetical protein
MYTKVKKPIASEAATMMNMKFSGNETKKVMIENGNISIILQNKNEKKAIATYSLG